MEFQVEVGERLRRVVVERQGDVFRVTVDGRTEFVDLRRINGDTLSLLLQGPADSRPVRNVEVSLVSGTAPGAFDVHLAGHRLPVRLRNGTAGRARRNASGAQGAGPQRVTSPMPGKVVRVLVQPGDEVHARQGLVVVEAMKMENELKATRHGRVGAVAVSEGQSVEAGAVLLIVEEGPRKS